MKRLMGWLLGVAGLVFVGMQLIPYGRAHTNPPVQAEPVWDSPQTKELFAKACADCHSNETVWPWYSNVAPVSWLVQKDVDEGRAKLNVSQWGSGEQEADDVQEVIQEGSMPPSVYLITHPEARLSSEQASRLVKGLIASFGVEGEEGAPAEGMMNGQSNPDTNSNFEPSGDTDGDWD